MLLVLGLLLAVPTRADIRTTKHNLSAYGPGTLKAEAESRICIFCHTPHRASQTEGLLWNRADSTATYIPYASETLRASVGQPTGATKLCLSCHDGTVALGEVFSEPAEIGFAGGVRFMPEGSSLIGVDLTDDHPVSFSYDAALVMQNPELRDPELLTELVRVDQFDQLQCPSCHDPHDEGFGQFLVAPLLGSGLCLTCHDPVSWVSSSHATSRSEWDGNVPDPWPDSDLSTVEDNACANCHRSHGAGSGAWILQYGIEEDNCIVCHNGQVATTDIELEITRPYRHPVELVTDVHAPNEDATLPMTEHVECSDCHDPHAATDGVAVPPLASGSLIGVSGVDQGGQAVTSVSYQYEVCFKCHGEFSMTDPPVNRQLLQVDKVLQFDPVNPSYHPIEAVGKNGDVPSLLDPYTESSVIYCTDCHASNAGPGTGGSAPAGPHGSIYPFILERQYNMVDGTKYDRTLYELCFKCHSEQSLKDGESFDKHKKHYEGEDTPCSVCHDPHGISATQGTISNNSHLINFDLNVVLPDPKTGRLEFVDDGLFAGRCYLECHGKKHSPKDYKP